MPGTTIKSNRTTKPKVKSGCRTCKIRKVKCDEGRPACLKCISTRRTCDGYGIWGGGSPLRLPTAPLPRTQNPLTISIPPSLSIFSSTTEEKRHFSWFQTHSSLKLPGSFVSGFWSTLLLQASINEPAVLHAVLALGSFHNRLTIPADEKNRVLDRQDVFMLRYYGQAISHLQPHFEQSDRGAVRVALISCIVFTCLDFLRGHFTSGQLHLKNGLKILAASYSSPSAAADESVICLQSTDDAIDTWIIEAFSRLHLQVELFNSSFTHPCLTLHLSLRAINENSKFYTVNEAWQSLERLFNLTFHLQSSSSLPSFISSPSPNLLQKQQEILTDLSTWLENYHNLKASFSNPPTTKEREKEKENDVRKTHHLPRIYHTLCQLLASTALSTTEAIYSTPPIISLFEKLLNQLIDLYTSSLPLPSPLPNFRQKNLIFISHSVMDLGWIPALFYVSTKCRVPRMRLHALRFLGFGRHREGCWDGGVAASIAQKIITLEMPQTSHSTTNIFDFDLTSYPRAQEIQLQEQSFQNGAKDTKGNRKQVREIEIRMRGEPMERVELFCSFDRGGESDYDGERKIEDGDKERGRGGQRELVGIWDVAGQCWDR